MTVAAPLAPVRVGPEGTPLLTLGWDVLGWTAKWLLQPDGPDAGTPWRATVEQARFLLWWYAIDDHGRFAYRSGVLRRMKGWGKDPLAAVLCAVEFVGPCRFEKWKGDAPELKTHPAAWIQIAAVSKEQTRNTMTLFPGLFSKAALSEYGIDMGKEIIYGHSGRCRIEAVTSSPRALEGGRATLTIQNETHHWLEANEGHEMAKVISRNAGKSRDGSSRVLSITNAHRIGEDSVAEREWDAYEKRRDGILYDSLEAPADVDVTDPLAVREALVIARGDSTWLDVDRITEEILDPRTDEPTARRFYLNQLRAEKSSWIRAAEWDACERDEAVPDRALITLGFDGSHYRDATALVGTVVATGYQWIVAVWERPELAAEDWEVPAVELKAVVEQTFARYDVWRLCADPWGWDETLAGWSALYGQGRQRQERIVAWRANLLGPMARLIKDYETAVRSRTIGHERSELFARHVANCVKRPTSLRDDDGQFAYVLSKDGPNSPRKIDVAMAALLSYRAYLDAITEGAGDYGRSALDSPDYALTVLN